MLQIPGCDLREFSALVPFEFPIDPVAAVSYPSEEGEECEDKNQ